MYLNPFGRRLLGFESLDEFRGSAVLETYLPADREAARLAFTMVRERGQWEGELRLRNRRTGEVIPVWHRLFTLVATPAALLAIGSGSAIILLEQPLGIWLILKLVAVTGMVGCHVLAGLLIVRLDHHSSWPVAQYCAALSIVSLFLILSVAWLVLRKVP